MKTTVQFMFPLLSLGGHDSFFTLHPDKAPPCDGSLTLEEVRSDVKALLIQLFLACCRSLASIHFWCSSSCGQTTQTHRFATISGLLTQLDVIGQLSVLVEATSLHFTEAPQACRRGTSTHLDFALGLHHLQFSLSQILLQLPDLSFEGFILPFAAFLRCFSLDALAVTRLHRRLALRCRVLCVGCGLVSICNQSALGAEPHGALGGGGGVGSLSWWVMSLCIFLKRNSIFPFSCPPCNSIKDH